MGNIIKLSEKTPTSQWISMSNGLTSVFVNVLGLSGSRLAKTEDEKRLIIWILEKNQSAIGLGTVGFDLCELPWNMAHFCENKAFLLSVAHGVKEKAGWETLDYMPNEALLIPVIEQFEGLLQQMSPQDIDLSAREEWLNAAAPNDPILNGFPKCGKHNAFLTIFGCQICAD